MLNTLINFYNDQLNALKSKVKVLEIIIIIKLFYHYLIIRNKIFV